MNDWAYETKLNELAYSPGPTPKSFLEIWQYEGLEPVIKEGDMEEENLVQWLETEPPTEKREGRAFTGGLKLLYASFHAVATIPVPHVLLQKPAFKEVMRIFQLPLEHAYVLESRNPVFTQFSPLAPGDRQGRMAYVFSSGRVVAPSIEMAASYDPETNTTCAYVQQGVRSALYLQRIWNTLKGVGPSKMHPFLLPILLMEGVIATHREGANAWSADVQNTEGHFADVLGKATRLDPLQLDLPEIVASLLRHGLLARQMRIHSEGLGILLTQLSETIREVTDDPTGSCKDPSIQQVSASLKRHITLLTGLNQGAIGSLRFLQERTDVLIIAANNYIAQRDSKLNITVAQDSKLIANASKRDSSSMKALAVLTMVFLPGTFVASFFAIPLFNWDAENAKSVVNRRFWIYWAVSIPLTILVIVVWGVWIRVIMRKYRKEDTEVQEGLDDEEKTSLLAEDRSHSRQGSEEGTRRSSVSR